MEQTKTINSIKLKGTFVDFSYSHTFKDYKYYKGTIIAKRLSEAEDIIPIMFREDNLERAEQSVGKIVSIVGEVRTLNSTDEQTQKRHLEVYVYTSFVPYETDSDEDVNNVMIEGYLCKNPRSRTTARGCHITDLFLAVRTKSANARSYYVPVITFFDVSLQAKDLHTGDKIFVEGRFQSRAYRKQETDGTTETRMAYEIVASKINQIEGD